MPRRSYRIFFTAALMALNACTLTLAASASAAVGLFSDQTDVGIVWPPGTARFDASRQVYSLTAAGANTWYHVDDFHFLWRPASGDLALTAEVRFPPTSYAHAPNPHRKGLLMIRQSLDSGSAYVDAAAHGSGLTALQYRRERGANSQDIELNIDLPRLLRLEKRGDSFTLLLSEHGEPPHPVGASIRLHLRDPFYIGLGAVSHDVDTVDTVDFARVQVEPLSPTGTHPTALSSTLQTIQTEDQFRRSMMIRHAAVYFGSAHWAPRTRSIYVFESGRILRIPYLTPEAGGEPQPVITPGLTDCTNQFGPSPDENSLAMTCAERASGPRTIYVLLLNAETHARRLTTSTARTAAFRAWSPDGQTIAFTRGAPGAADLYSVPATGGAERQLTRDGLNDDPSFSPDGQWIYFDSRRSGKPEIWRMKADGSAAEAITDDGEVNTSPQLSPDGKTLAFLSLPSDRGDALSPVALKVMTVGDGLIRQIVEFIGDRDSLCNGAWGDSNHLAFVSHEPLSGAAAATTAGGTSR